MTSEEDFELDFIQSHKIVGKLISVDILDKIRAEIVDLADSDVYEEYQQGFNYGLMRAAQIIDKYKEGDE